ncbi:molybdopterin molybdotransferase MoeA [Paracraurococcus lichenis]|uniref:Molybdopterin molybdenumtransferase n=1 Tax=Paracraurococcus lichenis TaxID=3064888 RepID=A0ABT9E8F8_9PROT|nr:molybdopterin molybdotransferase MoeA [Paracraurococcus sp. LOR1-02]MDO9712491.1 molybdopterin molybdotransferase MoeA [Paracraurococcus sp. LOR1-02]
MAQLTDDCFASNTLLSVDAAEALIGTRIPPLVGEEQVALADALGRVLAHDLHVPLPDPEGARFVTNAPVLPHAGGRRVQEDASHAFGTVNTPASRLDSNARLARGSTPERVVVLPAGRRLRVTDIGVAAALGCASLPVVPRVRVGVFSTGDELSAAGGARGPAQIYDSNRFTLLALLARLPTETFDLGIMPDHAGESSAALQAAAANHDLLLTSGGVSVGEEDHVRAAIEQSGRLVFWRLAVKPGRPVAMGVMRCAATGFPGKPVLGLPGNPVAAVVTFLHLARPLVLRLAGAAPEPLPRFPVEARFNHRKKVGRREYVLVRLRPSLTTPLAEKFERVGSGMQTSLTESDAFAELDEVTTAVVPGDAVQVLPFAALF